VSILHILSHLLANIRRRTWRCFKCLGGEAKSAKSRRSLASLTNSHEPNRLNPTERRAGVSRHTVDAQETTIRREATRVAAERKDLIARKSSLEYNGSPASLDGCVNQLERAREIVHPSQTIEHVSKMSTPGSSIFVATQSSSKKLNLYATTTEPSKDAIMAPASHMSGVDRGELTEIPNTPTQRSSQRQTPEPVPEPHGSRVKETNAIPLINGPKSSAKTTLITGLCSLCHKQRVLARRGSIDVIW
jgi:hypothetical protein